jgi:hypothetical protein
MQFSLHRGQIQVFKSRAKVRSIVAGRRTGKSRLLIYELLNAALSYNEPVDPISPQTVLGALPTLAQAKSILWKPLVSLCESPSIAPAVKNINLTDHRIDFYGKPSIYITGANDRDGDGMRGKRLLFAGLDEYADMKRGMLEAVIFPAMADTPGSRCLVSGTPKGRANHFYQLFQRAVSDPDTYASFQLPTWVNNVTPGLIDEIRRAKRILPPRLFRQEYMAMFEAYPGMVYEELSEQNYCDELPETFDTTWLAVDFGDRHPAVIALGVKDNIVYYLDGWEPDGSSVIAEPVFQDHIADLGRTWGVRGCYCDPSRPSSILSIRDVGARLGIPGLTKAIAGYNPIEDGITQVHSLIYQRRLRIPRVNRRAVGNVSGNDLYLKLESYHRDADMLGNVLPTIANGQDDHILDCIRYGCSDKTAMLANAV